MNLKKILIIMLILIEFTTFCFATDKEYFVDTLNKNIEDFEETEDISAIEEERKRIYSESAILIEQQTGKILYEKNIYDRKYPASTTKILTAIIALENCDLNEVATASQNAVDSVKSGYTNANIKVGESFTIEQLLDVMMIVSANEAATIIAEHISGSVSEFAKLMNKKAKEIGCLDSNFVNANGIHDEEHYSTAYDMAIIARYCMENEKFRELLAKKTCSLPVTEIYEEAIKTEIEEENERNKNKKKYKPKSIEDVSLERNFRNTNSLLKEDSIYYYQYCIGGKTGFTTPAKNCLISSSNKDGFELIAVVLHAETTDNELSARYTDTIKLFEYGYKNYNLEEIIEEADMVEYPEKANLFAGLLKNDDDNDNNIGNDGEYKKAIIEILAGLAILLFLGIIWIYKIIRKSSLNKLYNFKLN